MGNQVTKTPRNGASRLGDHPVELSPRFTTTRVNKRIPLVPDGDLILSKDRRKCFKGKGHIVLEWLPRPAIRFNASLADANISDALSEEIYGLVLHKPERSLRARVTHVAISSGQPMRVQGKIINEDLPSDLEAGGASFVLANFRADLGRTIRDAEARSLRRDRSEFAAEGWSIILDGVPARESVEDELEATGGYGITHTGWIERTDKSSFRANELDGLLDDLFWFFSFCRGFKTGPVLVEMHGKGRFKRWLYMSCPIIEPWRPQILWFSPVQFGVLESVFHGYLRRVRNRMWTKPIKNAIHWYLGVHDQAGAIDGAIIFGQVAMEMLGWTLLVDEKRYISSEGYGKLPAADKMRLLLSACRIPLEIPSKLSDLVKTAKAENWSDGPQCVAEIRNAIVHSNPKKSQRLDRASFQSKGDTWQLCLWYLELTLLWLFDYGGKYDSRMGSGQWRGQNVQRVPWAK